MELKSSVEGNVITIVLPERIDTLNASEAEAAINSALDANSGYREVVLDASDLTYISSVGLRVILRLKRSHDDLKIVEVASEPYEVFEMTGFTEMISVTKKMREVSIAGCPMIGEGYYGRVYRISPDTIVKHYYRGSPISEIDRERKLAKSAFVSGVPTAIAYDVVKVKEGGYGAVYELIEAKSLKSLILGDLDHMDKYLDLYAGLLKKIGSTKADESLPRCAELAKKWLDADKKVLSPSLYEAISKLLDTIADENVLVHGDCHFKNIFVLPDGEPILIDMDSIERGARIYEYASLYIAYIAYELDDPGNSLRFMGAPDEVLHKIYRGILRRIFADRNDDEFELAMKKIEFLGNVHFLEKALRDEDGDEFGRIPHTIERIEKAIDGLQDLKLF